MEMNYLTALKDYKVLVMDFAASLGISLLIGPYSGSAANGYDNDAVLCVILAYGLLMTLYYRQLLKYFPKAKRKLFFLPRWFDKYRSLTLYRNFCQPRPVRPSCNHVLRSFAGSGGRSVLWGANA